MKHALSTLAALLATAASLLPVSNASAAFIYTSGHGDIGVGYEEGAFEPHWHLAEPTEAEYAPGDAFALIQATRNAPSGAAAMLGVTEGSSIWVAGSAAYQPNLGIATEELNPDDWVGNITLTLSGWSGPGEFALYTTNVGGSSVVDVYFSTFDSASTFGDNSFEMFAGSHEHFSLGFTAPGYYELEFTWTGTHVTDGEISTSGTFGFQVVPEPGAAALAGVCALVLAAGTRRRRKGAH